MTNPPKIEVLNTLIFVSGFAGAFALNIVPAIKGPQIGACLSFTFFCTELVLSILRYRLNSAPIRRDNRMPERGRTRRYRR